MRKFIFQIKTNNTFDIQSSLNVGKKYLVPFSIFFLLYIISVILGLVLLIIPAILISVRFFSVPYIFMLKNIDFKRSAYISNNINKGKFWTIFGALGISSIIILVLKLLFNYSLSLIWEESLIINIISFIFENILCVYLVIVSYFLYEKYYESLELV